MPTPVFLDVDPRTLHLPPSSRHGADPGKLQRQIARFGRSTAGMPAPWVYRGSDGALVISNGVTRATRVAKLLPACSAASRSSATRRPRSATTPRSEIACHDRSGAERSASCPGRAERVLPGVPVRPDDRESGDAGSRGCRWRVWDMADEELLAAARKHLTDWNERHAPVA